MKLSRERKLLGKTTAKQALVFLIVSGFFKNTFWFLIVGISSKKMMLGYKQKKFQTERQKDVVCTHIPSYRFLENLVSCL